MANEQNLVNLATRPQRERQEIARKGQEASTEAKKEKASLKKATEWLMTVDLSEIKTKDFEKGSLAEFFSTRGFDISNLDASKLATLGNWLGAVYGNSSNYRTLGDYNNENVEDSSVSTPTLKIEVSDNSKLEKVLYEENRSEEDANK